MRHRRISGFADRLAEGAGFAGDNNFAEIAAWVFAAMFALRAIGDFRYVGFFKRIRDTRFARLDTLAYSPLCAVLAVLIGIAASR